MRLTFDQLSALRVALHIATESELEFISCHTNRHTGKIMDPEAVRKARSIIRRWAALHKKITAQMKTLMPTMED
jgi:hypothetical protein